MGACGSRHVAQLKGEEGQEQSKKQPPPKAGQTNDGKSASGTVLGDSDISDEKGGGGSNFQDM